MITNIESKIGISFIGYETKIIELSNYDINDEIIIMLNPYEEFLEEVIITNKPIYKILENAVNVSRKKMKETAILTSYNREILKTDNDYCYFADAVSKYHIKGKGKKIKSKLELISSRIKEGMCLDSNKFIEKSPFPYNLEEFIEVPFDKNRALNSVIKADTARYVFKIKSIRYDSIQVNKIEFKPKDTLNLKGLDVRGYAVYDDATSLILDIFIEKASNKKEDGTDINIFIAEWSNLDFKQNYRFRYVDNSYYISYIMEYQKIYINNLYATKYDKTYSFFTDLTTLNYEVKSEEYEFDRYKKDFIYLNGHNYKSEFWNNVSKTESEEEENFNL
jgi:hypothetical protein